MFGSRLKKQYGKIFAVLAVLLFFLYANISDSSDGYTAQASLVADEELLPVMVSDIRDAKDNIFCAIYMFKTDDRKFNLSNDIQKALVKAAERGVKVYVAVDIGRSKKSLTTEFNTDTGLELEAAGITVVYDTPSKRMHAKVLTVDGKISYVGSHNYTHSALKYNNEVTARIVSAEFASELNDYIRGIQ